MEEEVLTEALRAEVPAKAQALVLRYIEKGNKCGNFRVHHLPRPPTSVKTQEENKMEEDADEDVSYSGEK